MAKCGSCTRNDGGVRRHALVAVQGETENEEGLDGSGDGEDAQSEDVDVDTDSAMVESFSNMVEHSGQFEGTAEDNLVSVFAPRPMALGKRI